MLELKQTFAQSCKFGKEQIKDGGNKTHRDKEYRSFRHRIGGMRRNRTGGFKEKGQGLPVVFFDSLLFQRLK